MKRTVKYSVIMLVFLIAASCIQEVRFDENSANGNEIQFAPDNFEMTTTKSGSDFNQDKPKRVFLGIIPQQKTKNSHSIMKIL